MQLKGKWIGGPSDGETAFEGEVNMQGAEEDPTLLVAKGEVENGPVSHIVAGLVATAQVMADKAGVGVPEIEDPDEEVELD